MTLPWFLNPWAEVRRLRAREALASTTFDVLFADYQKAQFHASSLKSEHADLRRRIAEREMELNSWGQRYATQCPINVMVEQENACLRGDPSPLSCKVDSYESGAENCGFLPKSLSDDSHEFRCYCGHCFGKPVKMWGGD